MAVYFATWDFRRASDFIFAMDMQARCIRGEPVDRFWSTGARASMANGSILVMMRQGQPKRGVIGIGRSVGEPYTQPRHDDPSRIGNYVAATWQHMFVDPVVPESELPDNYRGMRGGGWEVPEELAAWLIAEFNRLRPRNELEIADAIASDPGVSETDRQAIVTARRGQGRFRDGVARIERACRITGIDNPALLRASHIKPWAVSSNEERLDGNNGFLLSPNVDHLFDRGFMSFADDGTVLLSAMIEPGDVARLGIRVDVSVGEFSPSQQIYLAFHRRHVFRRGL